MIMCLCNPSTEKEIEKLCDECSSKEEYIACVKSRYKPGSCMTCYVSILEKYEEEKNAKIR